jgi:hypothetical protein
VVEAAISVAAVRANQLPRTVSCADALLPSTVNVNMPSRLRSATVIPETGLSQLSADSEAHTPRCLRKPPLPFRQASRAALFAGDKIVIGARGSLGASSCAGWQSDSGLLVSCSVMIRPHDLNAPRILNYDWR